VAGDLQAPVVQVPDRQSCARNRPTRALSVPPEAARLGTAALTGRRLKRPSPAEDASASGVRIAVDEAAQTGARCWRVAAQSVPPAGLPDGNGQPGPAAPRSPAPSARSRQPRGSARTAPSPPPRRNPPGPAPDAHPGRETTGPQPTTTSGRPAEKTSPRPTSNNTRVGWPGGIAPPGSHRTERDSLPSLRSSHRIQTNSRSHAHCLKSPGAR
jgi:hypothetical protein